ncbi:MAG: glycosyltransferase [Hydrotalea sp. AMD]|uniref:glycosyltransferase family 2 protein n=1 Tax=Hydrotalea sp. AMD TaxID=2501297 RepID=UPI0009BDD4C5|nr:glycosyltransferase family 2 protein [Hydrotalea sp. AMD]RWZ90730.1 MAG: glycosyltransferase [Hydrotalea sp. AMD]
MEPIIKISVVICTYNRAAYIAAALESLVQQTFNKNWFEVIVVNNNSTDNTEQICKKFIADHSQYAFYFLNETQQGASFARNTGANLAKGSLLCFMDDDAIADPDYLEKIVDFFEIHSDAGGLGGRIIPKYIPAEPKWMSYYVASLVGNFDYSNNICVFQQGKYPLESNMIIRTADFKAIGGFNKNLPGVVGTMRIGGEGKDFFYRLQALGKKIYYHPGIIVHHVVEVNKLTKKYMYRVASGIGRGERRRVLAISRWAYVKKLIEYCFKLGAAFILAIQYTLQGNPAKAWPVIQFRIDALKGLLIK